MADPWDVFNGDDEEIEDGDDIDNVKSDNKEFVASCAAVSALALRWLNHSSSLKCRHVLFLVNKVEPFEYTDLVSIWKEVFESKQIDKVTLLELSWDSNSECVDHLEETALFDAIVLLSPSQIPAIQSQKVIQIVEKWLVSGGCFLFDTKFPGNSSNTVCDMVSQLSEAVWDMEASVDILVQETCTWVLLSKWSCVVDVESCHWLSRSHHSIAVERRNVAAASVALSVQERMSGQMLVASLRKAESALRVHGYCIIAGLLHSERNICLQYGVAAKSDLDAASTILKKQGIDLFHPSVSTKEPDTYRELSMREDCRMDLRHGPVLSALRGSKGNGPVTFTALDQEDAGDFLRGNANILSIVRRVMNPPTSNEWSTGNYGRYNFQGRGPDGSDRDMVAGPLGAILNLPGSADQAIHADTPHLFEHIVEPSPLPPHYINVFTLGCPPEQRVGQTAFVHGSHTLEFVSSHIRRSVNDTETSVDPFLPSLWKYLVRPRMDLGDVLLFDCRILHFGLANQHPSMVRPMLYTNLTLHWFHDPKNWDEHSRIFSYANDLPI